MLLGRKSKNLMLNKRINLRPIAILLSIVMCLSSVIGAFIAPISVFALSLGGLNSTIASIILSLLLSSGAAPVNNAWLTSLNTAYGVESSIGTIADCIESGLLTETATGLVDSGLSTAIQTLPEYTSLGIDEVFTTVASDGVAAATGAVNIANTAIEVGTLGTIATFAGAAIAGVGAGVIASKVISWVGDNIQRGLDIRASQELLATVGNGNSYSGVIYRNGSSARSTIADTNVVGVGYWRDSSRFYYGLVNFNDTAVTGKYCTNTDNITWTDFNISTGVGNYTSLSDPVAINNVKIFDSSTSIHDWYNDVKNGEAEKPYIHSPDIISPAGNVYYNPTTNIYNNIGNQVPQGYNVNPVDISDYLNFANDANSNTFDGSTGEDDNGELFNDLFTPLLNPANVVPDPEPENPIDPSNPDHPAQPEQPDIPEKPDVSETELEESLNLATTPELKEVFPFCIPWDIVDCLLLFRVTEREAPYIEFTFIDGNEITLDFSIFDSVAELLRILELISFIVGLAIGTRYLIGAS